MISHYKQNRTEKQRENELKSDQLRAARGTTDSMLVLELTEKSIIFKINTKEEEKKKSHLGTFDVGTHSSI